MSTIRARIEAMDEAEREGMARELRRRGYGDQHSNRPRHRFLIRSPGNMHASDIAMGGGRANVIVMVEGFEGMLEVVLFEGLP